MKLNTFFKLFLLLGIVTFTFSSCETDPIDGGTNAPTITLASGSSSAITVAPNEAFTVRVNASKGANDLQALSVYEDGTLVSIDRLKFNGNDASANPRLLLGTETSSATYDIEIKAHSEASVTKKYSIEVRDVSSVSRNVTVDVATDATPPTLTYNGPATVPAGANSLISLNISATKGTGKIASISVTEDSVLVDASRVEIGSTPFSANPFTLPTQFQDGITNEMLVIRSSTTPGPKNIKITITAEDGTMSMQSLVMNVGVPVEANFGVLFNQSGPDGTGGLDLENALGTGSASTLAHIRDMGVVDPVNDATWRQQISGVNGSELKLITKGIGGVSESFSFGGVDFKSEIVTLFGQGSAVTISNKLVGGEVFAVKNGDKYYLIEIAEVNITTSNNEDNYKVNIKK